MKVYAITSGGIHDGCSVKIIFSTHENAKKHVLAKMELEYNDDIEYYNSLPEEEKDEMTTSFFLEKWKEEKPNYWVRNCDFYSIDEFDVQGE